MKAKTQEKDILTARSAAAAVVFFISAPILFILWFRFGWGNGGALFGWTWHAPVIAIVICTTLAYFMPEKMVDFTGKMIGSLFLWGP